MTEDALDNAFTHCLPDFYGGIEGGFIVTIHVMKAGMRDAEAIVAAMPDRPNGVVSRLRFKTATASLSSLSLRAALLTQNTERLRNEGVQLNGWGPDVTKNLLVVRVGNPSAGVRHKIERVVGSQNLDVEAGSPARY